MKCLKLAKRTVTRSQVERLTFGVNSLKDDFVDEVYQSALPYSEVPGPRPIPFLGNSWRFIPYVGDFSIEHVDQISKRLFKQYGSIVKISGLMGRPDMIFLYDPNEIERVFRREDSFIPLRPSMPSLDYYKHVLRKDFFGDSPGVIAVHGEKWREFRTKVQQIVLQPRIAKMYTKPIEDTAKDFVKRIHRIRDASEEVPQDFLNEIHKWSLESLARVALDVRLGCFDSQSNDETQTLIDAVNTFFINVPVLELKIPFWRIWSTPTWKKYIRALDTLTDISMKHINKALVDLKSKPKVDDPSLLQRVLISTDPKTACILALDMFLVGIDTTSNAVASVLYQLALHPEKQERLYREVKATPAADLDKISYLRACIKETMRMYPVVIGNGRCTTSDCVISGYQIPKGVQVVFQHYAISNMEEYFSDSGKFEPERWLKSETEDRRCHSFASLPFGFGKRMCLGRRFADLEMQIVIAKIIQTYKLEYHHEKLDYHVHPMYTPDGPLRLRFIERNRNRHC